MNLLILSGSGVGRGNLKKSLIPNLVAWVSRKSWLGCVFHDGLKYLGNRNTHQLLTVINELTIVYMLWVDLVSITCCCSLWLSSLYHIPMPSICLLSGRASVFFLKSVLWTEIGVNILSLQGPDITYLMLCIPYSLCRNYSTLPLKQRTHNI